MNKVSPPWRGVSSKAAAADSMRFTHLSLFFLHHRHVLFQRLHPNDGVWNKFVADFILLEN